MEEWGWEEWGGGEGFDRFGQKDKQKEPVGKRAGGTVQLWARGWRMWGERTRGQGMGCRLGWGRTKCCCRWAPRVAVVGQDPGPGRRAATATQQAHR